MAENDHPKAGKKVGALVGIAVIFATALVGYFIWTGRIAGGKPRCQVCNRELMQGSLFVTVDAKGSKRHACCPRCGLRSVLENGGEVLEATDFSTGKMIPAVDAVYLEGSDIMKCCSTTGFRVEDGAYSDIEYDRCMPSLLAFSTRAEAELVQRDHGGQIISLEAARQSVARQMGR